ncbi:hypothetical protein GKZ90_0005850 [Flavobacterium sp. MC2016-06]|uniref:hypothetical protein n=1 Tax=Flavobacterium sp. MC2016-06 TaxID=2676308 RepID=UPI0012BB16E2|nr:hypothetical protein [Flavobacterium sp. MC2016-06]MBU3857661.1 hypothetical protein [Flavobacterium sp. MC2016-06]
MKKTFFKTFFYFFIILLIACEGNKEKKTEKTAYWDEIVIFTRNQKITVRQDSDTANFENRMNTRGNSENEILSKSFLLNKKERDSLHKFVYKMITKPVFTDKNATCYAGYVSISLRDRNTTLGCEYKSVGEWSTVSSETQKIYKLLSEKIEISRQ